MSEQQISECTYCGKIIPYDATKHVKGRTGEIACDDCEEKEGEN